ncbi:hypothetical protein KAZ01_03680 [Candidatus Gracilibacteria bacterium]|nr:hypothetical protein [Candidatus Gracilibacteria bacterium]
MSRSIKQPIKKDKPRNFQKSAIYWRTIRRVINYTLRKFRRDVDEMVLPKEKSIVNDYDYTDWISDCRNDNNCYCIRNYGTKKCTRKGTQKK